MVLVVLFKNNESFLFGCVNLYSLYAYELSTFDGNY